MAIDSGDGAENAKTRVGFTGIHEAVLEQRSDLMRDARVLAFSGARDALRAGARNLCVFVIRASIVILFEHDTCGVEWVDDD